MAKKKTILTLAACLLTAAAVYAAQCPSMKCEAKPEKDPVAELDAKPSEQSTLAIELYVDMALGLCDKQAAEKRAKSLKGANFKEALNRERLALKSSLVRLHQVNAKQFVRILKSMKIQSSSSQTTALGASHRRAYLESTIFLDRNTQYVAVVTTELAGLPKKIVERLKLISKDGAASAPTKHGRKTAGKSLLDPVSSLNGATRILMVDRSCKHPRVEYPRGKLQEAQYTKDTRGISYVIEFSADGSAVKVVTDKTIEGLLASDVDGVKMYRLKTFASGRLVVRPDGKNYEAELTIYGSGVPIISSVRGKLVEKESSNK